MIDKVVASHKEFQRIRKEEIKKENRQPVVKKDKIKEYINQIKMEFNRQRYEEVNVANISYTLDHNT